MTRCLSGRKAYSTVLLCQDHTDLGKGLSVYCKCAIRVLAIGCLQNLQPTFSAKNKNPSGSLFSITKQELFMRAWCWWVGSFIPWVIQGHPGCLGPTVLCLILPLLDHFFIKLLFLELQHKLLSPSWTWMNNFGCTFHHFFSSSLHPYHKSCHSSICCWRSEWWLITSWFFMWILAFHCPICSQHRHVTETSPLSLSNT